MIKVPSLSKTFCMVLARYFPASISMTGYLSGIRPSSATRSCGTAARRWIRIRKSAPKYPRARASLRREAIGACLSPNGPRDIERASVSEGVHAPCFLVRPDTAAGTAARCRHGCRSLHGNGGAFSWTPRRRVPLSPAARPTCPCRAARSRCADARCRSPRRRRATRRTADSARR